MKKRMIVVSDLHCGHRWGAMSSIKINSKYGNMREVAEAQLKLTNWREKEIKRHGPYDLCLVNGDALDGRGEFTGGREELEGSLIDQSETASMILKEIKAKEYIVTCGTAYHTGKFEDYERLVAKDLNTELVDASTFGINGRFFDARHFVGNSTSPLANKAVAIKKHQVFNALDTYAQLIIDGKNQSVIPTVYIRSHVHKFDYCSGSSYKILLMTTPCFQMKSMYGSRQCVGIIDYGFLIFEVSDNGEMTWKPVIFPERFNSEVRQY